MLIIVILPEGFSGTISRVLPGQWTPWLTWGTFWEPTYARLKGLERLEWR